MAGASGTIGTPIAAALAARGHEVRALSRGSAEFPVDLRTGAGLGAALAGCQVVVDATNAGPGRRSAYAVLVEGGHRLLEAARQAEFGHHVCLSIVGIDRVPLPYYRVKLEQEQLVRNAGVPFSILRATQFHPLIADLLSAGGRLRLLPGGSARLQPVDPAEVAELAADLAEGAPTGGRTTMAGPRVQELGELARAWRSAGGGSGAVVPVPLAGELGRALRAGALTDRKPDRRGSVDFETWLAGAGAKREGAR